MFRVVKLVINPPDETHLDVMGEGACVFRSKGYASGSFDLLPSGSPILDRPPPGTNKGVPKGRPGSLTL